MSKKLKIIALILSVSLLLFGGVFITGNTTPTYAVTYQLGSKGDVVKKIQTKLKNWGYYSGSIDGIYGAKTVEAVKYFQRKNKLTVDGIAGNKTLAAMGIAVSSTSATTSSSYTSKDLDLLAHLIYGEARGESYTGQVAVGAVVMNRIKSSSFPNTMSGVIYQSYAFTAVNDGQINLTPNATAKRAAQDALNGYDPTNGAIYYYNPKTATSSWIFSRKTTIVIGNHVFAK